VARTYATEIALCGYRFDDPEPLLLDGRIARARSRRDRGPSF
jgi:hypothetical protein